MKKEALFVLLTFSLLFIPLASAGIGDTIEKKATNFFEKNKFSENEEATLGAAYFIMVLILVYSILTKIFPDSLSKQKGIVFIISAVVSLLAARYSSNLMFFYLALGSTSLTRIILLAIIPFTLILILLHMSKFSSSARRATWIIFGAISGLVLAQRYSETDPTTRKIYYLFLGLIAIAFFLDKWLQKYIFKRIKSKKSANVQAPNQSPS